jgi:hypothetical protein
MSEPSFRNSLTRPIRIFVDTWPNFRRGGISRDAKFIQNSFENDSNFHAIIRIEKVNLPRAIYCDYMVVFTLISG